MVEVKPKTNNQAQSASASRRGVLIMAGIVEKREAYANPKGQFHISSWSARLRRSLTAVIDRCYSRRTDGLPSPLLVRSDLMLIFQDGKQAS
jgi:hypothetical protein